ncbi:thiol-disulfide isomerase/thioredoxin [Mucilaginibacter yixingensis]|uniref:Thiol-disulfide isomerase/thioredoxin n=1 Tax=Mucilaginibacter yixingensis TaxID=1295612 RepID=A0A2T5J6K1_9SPHI|nr:TlpA disulfide reductase family protein [Mucilaginibacter yixingensis]PTQ94163.1 thiol-disulfide isomerase/thioredoxin [Mucilaginibacter yixingensis]
MLNKTVKLFFLIFLVCPIMSQAQRPNRSLLQNTFFDEKVTIPQLKLTPGGLSLKNTSTVDSVCHILEATWAKESSKYYKDYRSDYTPEQFNQLDAYVYLRNMMEVAQTMSLPDNCLSHLTKYYMVPALQRDYETIKSKPTLSKLELIHSGSLGNTITLGTKPETDRETFYKCYELYNKYDELLRQFVALPDTAISNYAKSVLDTQDEFYYDINARYQFYQNDLDKSAKFLLEGLNNHRYSRRRVWGMTKPLVESYNATGLREKSITILNALLLNTTPDIVNRNSLRKLYQETDPENGEAIYNNILAQQGNSFRKNGRKIKLPLHWKFLANQVTPERLKKAKFFLVDVWSTHCVPCLEEMPELNKLYKKYADQEDILFLSINVDFSEKGNIGDVKKTVKRLGIHFPVFYDNQLSKLQSQLAVQSLPSKSIINKQGELFIKNDDSEITRNTFDLFFKEYSNISKSPADSRPGASK